MSHYQKNRENGLSLIDSIIAIVGLSVIFIAIFTISTTSVNLSNYNAKNDQAFQIARSVMEEIKTQLLNYSGGPKINLGLNQENSNILCKETSEFYCKPGNPEVDLVDLAKIVKETETQCTSVANPSPVIVNNDAKTVFISMRTNQNDYYTVRIEASIPAPGTKINYTSTNELQLCKFIRKFKVTVTPPGTSGNKPVIIEAYYPIPS